MPFISFLKFYNDLGLKEMRSFAVPSGAFGVPIGEYDLLENYCDERGCDCRKVMVNIISVENDSVKIWATIHFGWENPSYYHEYFSKDIAIAQKMSGSYLEPLGEQSKHAPRFLGIWAQIIRDENYVERLKRHYKLFKEKI